MDTHVNLDLIERIATSFSPSAPINKKAFAGREAQINDVVSACMQRGQHVVIFGERGAGKTSLANALSQMLVSRFVMPDCGTINCDQTTTFASLWRAILSEIPISRNATNRSPAGPDRAQGTFAQFLPENVTPHAVTAALQNRGKILIIVDEVDRIQDKTTTTLLADTIKSLSDHVIDTTLVLVGVAESVETLIAEHESIQRALVQVHMPRMSQSEIDTIIDNGLSNVRMTIHDNAKRRLFKLSQGLPHYAHLLGMHSAMTAAAQGRMQITIDDAHQALRKALRQAQHGVGEDYERVAMAISDNLNHWVLLACALASTDEHGYFSARDVGIPLRMLMKKDFPVTVFNHHLAAYCETRNGPVLRKTASARGFRFKFRNAAMQPYIILKALEAKKIS